MNPFRPSSTLPPVVYGVNPNDYHAPDQYARGDARRTMSRSELEDFHRCPSKWIRGTPEESTKATEWGSLIDCLVLTPERFETDYAVAPETYEKRTMMCPDCGSVSDSLKCSKCNCARHDHTLHQPWNWNAKQCEQWRTEREAEGKAIVKHSDACAAHKAVARLHEDEIISELLSVSKRQVQINVEYADPETGIVVPIKCLLDLMPDPRSKFGNMLGDLKTTFDASPSAWAKHVFWMGYANQAALYMDATNAATGRQYDTWAHVIQESEPPYETARRILDAEFLQIGRATYLRQLVDYCWCLKKNTWPGYDDWKARADLSDGWRIISPQAWMLTADY